MKARVLILIAVSFALSTVACSAATVSGYCSADPFFTVSPLDVSDIDYIRPLGGINPPSHTFPTDHIYLYMHQDTSGIPFVVPFYAPGDMTVTTVSASQHVKAGFTDFSLELQPCRDVTVVFGHISSLEADVFGDTTAFSGWTLSNEYTTGGETYRLWRKETSINVRAGQQLGTTGGRRGQYALDLGVYDERRSADAVANVSRWLKSRVLYSVCPFDYFAEGPIRQALLNLIESEVGTPAESRCFTVFQDEPGTARGCWFVEGTSKTYPEDPHLALVTSNIRPSRYVFSVGTSIPGLDSGKYEFAPHQAGTLNRPFDVLRPDGTIYGYAVDSYSGTLIVAMPDASTLWIEALPVGNRNSQNWIFSDRKVVFKR